MINILKFNPKYKLHKIIDNLYLVEMDNLYDLAMTFVRYQEYYESPNSDVRGQTFSLEEYMRWYSLNNGQKYPTFSYPSDFCGYNIPSTAIKDILYDGNYIGSLTMYDKLMLEIFQEINNCNNQNGKDFYLIGASEMDSTTLKHEIAHGLYFVNSEYKQHMINLINSNLSLEEIKDFKLELSKMHYCEEVMYDEMQAFISTDEKLRKSFPAIDMSSFKEYFELYYKDISPILLSEYK